MYLIKKPTNFISRRAMIICVDVIVADALVSHTLGTLWAWKCNSTVNPNLMKMLYSKTDSITYFIHDYDCVIHFDIF